MLGELGWWPICNNQIVWFFDCLMGKEGPIKIQTCFLKEVQRILETPSQNSNHVRITIVNVESYMAHYTKYDI